MNIPDRMLGPQPDGFVVGLLWLVALILLTLLAG
jgi:hypothetical protein